MTWAENAIDPGFFARTLSRKNGLNRYDYFDNLDISANSGANAELIGADTTSLPVARIVLSNEKTSTHPPNTTPGMLRAAPLYNMHFVYLHLAVCQYYTLTRH